MSRVVLLQAHAIEEYMQTLLMHELGHEVFNIGGYIDPAHPHDSIRPALPQVPTHWDLKAVVDACPGPDSLWSAKDNLPDDIVDWAEIIICHEVEWRWLIPNWPKIRRKRVIWRTVGQSADANERRMKPLREDGLEIIRYSPREANIPGYIGADAMIRFWMDADEWTGWNGCDAVVTNITQDLYGRSTHQGDVGGGGPLALPGYQWTNYTFWEAATTGLATRPGGAKSEAIGGVGLMEFEAMKQLLRDCRAYLYTGTQPAPYTLGFIEALMMGIPMVSIGPGWMRMIPYGPELFEAHEFVPYWSNRPDEANRELRRILEDDDYARMRSDQGRATAIEVFGKAKVMEDWRQYLEGSFVKPREAVAA